MNKYEHIFIATVAGTTITLIESLGRWRLIGVGILIATVWLVHSYHNEDLKSRRKRR